MADLSNFQQKDRDKIIVRTSIVGIAANILLAAFKAVIGLLSNSIAITLDAVNNLSDAASSVITIIGTKLAGKAPDKKHPFGYGRTEYLSAMVISIIVLYAGITSLRESIAKIIHPETPDYSAAALIIVASAVIVKIVLGLYVKKTGEKVNSDSLVNSGTDAMLDSVISAATLAAAVIYIFSKISLEAWLGAVISIVIIKSGFEMLGETISKIMGERADAELAKKIKSIVSSHDEVHGAYDLILNNYGPDSYNGSIHIEVLDTLTASEIDVLTRRITNEVFSQCNVILTAISVYSLNTTDKTAAELREKITSLALSHDHIIQLHGFFCDTEKKYIRFDLVISFDAPNRSEAYRAAVDDIKKQYPEYEFDIVMDTDFSESD